MEGVALTFTETELAGAYLVAIEPVADERGFFARAFDEAEFARRGLSPRVTQINLSFNLRRATLRGMHYQAAPYAEAKLVRCTRGAIHDVIVDLRDGSPTRLRWTSARLAAGDGRALYVPEGCAHGFLTLEDETEVLYQVSAAQQPGAERGVRWDDPALGIDWPLAPAVISPRDRAFPLL